MVSEGMRLFFFFFFYNVVQHPQLLMYSPAASCISSPGAIIRDSVPIAPKSATLQCLVEPNWLSYDRLIDRPPTPSETPTDSLRLHRPNRPGHYGPITVSGRTGEYAGHSRDNNDSLPASVVMGHKRETLTFFK